MSGEARAEDCGIEISAYSCSVCRLSWLRLRHSSVVKTTFHKKKKKKKKYENKCLEERKN